MNNVRLLLWFSLLFVAWLNVDAWMQDREAAARQAQAAAPPPPAAGAVVPAAPGSGLADALPTVGVPDALPATGGAATDVPTGRPPVATTVRVRTDVLDLDVSLEGGSLVRADLPAYPLRKNDPNTPVRLFDKGSAPGGRMSVSTRPQMITP